MRKPYQSPGQDEKLILLYCPGRGLNSRPPAHRSFKNMVKASHALNHSATEAVFWLHKITYNSDNAVNPPNSKVWHYLPTLPLYNLMDFDTKEAGWRFVPVYRYLVGSGDSVTVHKEGGYCHSTPSPAFLSRDRGSPSPPMADTHQSPSLLSWRYTIDATFLASTHVTSPAH